MVFRRIVTTVVGACALGGLGAWVLAQVVPSSFILRSAGELSSLRLLLEDEAAWADLESLADHLSLFRVRSVTEALGPGEACEDARPSAGGDGGGDEGLGPETPHRIRHVFDFADPDAVSSRVYRVEYASCVAAGDGRTFRRIQSGFRSDFARLPSPFLEGAVPLRILRAALRDETVARDLVLTMREAGIGVCTVRYRGPGPVPGVDVWSFVASDSEPPTSLRLQYAVEYDAAADSARFTREP